jgi:hypothetical protein
MLAQTFAIMPEPTVDSGFLGFIHLGAVNPSHSVQSTGKKWDLKTC